MDLINSSINDSIINTTNGSFADARDIDLDDIFTPTVLYTILGGCCGFILVSLFLSMFGKLWIGKLLGGASLCI